MLAVGISAVVGKLLPLLAYIIISDKKKDDGRC